MNSLNKIAVVDIGNSNIKSIIDNRKIISDFSSDWTKKIITFLHENLSADGIVAISSVQPARFSQLVDKINHKIITADELLSNQNIIDFSEILGIGNDRLLGLIGALMKYSPPLITVDCGTAVTINILNEIRKCLGGVIFAGIQTQLEALSLKAAQLNRVDLFLENNVVGKKTESAIRNGIIYGVTGSVLYIIEQIIIQHKFQKDINLILTGGSSKLIHPLLEKSNRIFHLEENLVLDGLLHLINQTIGTNFAKF